MEKSLKIVLVSLGVVILAIIMFLFLNYKPTYTIKFDTAGGNEISDQIVKKGELIVRPANPIKDNYVFTNWYYNGEVFDFSVPVTKNMTIVAGFEESKVKYTVRFENETEVKTYVVEKGKLVVEPNEPTKEGYVFLGWYVKDTKFDFSTPIVNNIVLKAKFVAKDKKIYEVSFNTAGGSNVKTQKVEKDSVVTKPNSPTKSGYKFDGWYLNDKKFDFNTKITSNITLTAKWIKAYQVTFDSDGGSKIKTQEVAEGNKMTKPSNPTKSGYKFDGWYLNDKKFDFNTKITTNITLKAKWLELVKYTITFDTAGGSKVKNQEVFEGGKITKPENPTKEGYDFKEWQLDGKAYNFNTPVNKNIELVAVWTKKLVKYKVTFNSMGGSEVASKEVNEGEKVTKPEVPTKKGYVFKEWQLNGKTYDFNTPINKNIELVAVWEEAAKNYTFKISLVDDYSPDRVINVYADGKEITFKYIKIDGITICSGKNPTVNKAEIEGITIITVELNDGRTITAKKA